MVNDPNFRFHLVVKVGLQSFEQRQEQGYSSQDASRCGFKTTWLLTSRVPVKQQPLGFDIGRCEKLMQLHKVPILGVLCGPGGSPAASEYPEVLHCRDTPA